MTRRAADWVGDELAQRVKEEAVRVTRARQAAFSQFVKDRAGKPSGKASKKFMTWLQGTSMADEDGVIDFGVTDHRMGRTVIPVNANSSKTGSTNRDSNAKNASGAFKVIARRIITVSNILAQPMILCIASSSPLFFTPQSLYTVAPRASVAVEVCLRVWLCENSPAPLPECLGIHIASLTMQYAAYNSLTRPTSNTGFSTGPSSHSAVLTKGASALHYRLHAYVGAPLYLPIAPRSHFPMAQAGEEQVMPLAVYNNSPYSLRFTVCVQLDTRTEDERDVEEGAYNPFGLLAVADGDKATVELADDDENEKPSTSLTLTATTTTADLALSRAHAPSKPLQALTLTVGPFAHMPFVCCFNPQKTGAYVGRIVLVTHNNDNTETASDSTSTASDSSTSTTASVNLATLSRSGVSVWPGHPDHECLVLGVAMPRPANGEYAPLFSELLPISAASASTALSVSRSPRSTKAVLSPAHQDKDHKDKDKEPASPTMQLPAGMSPLTLAIASDLIALQRWLHNATTSCLPRAVPSGSPSSSVVPVPASRGRFALAPASGVSLSLTSPLEPPAPPASAAGSFTLPATATQCHVWFPEAFADNDDAYMLIYSPAVCVGPATGVITRQ